MKKLILAVLTAALMSIGLVGVSTTSANAACTPSQYQVCSATSSSVTVTRNAGGRPTGLNITVNSTSASNVPVTGSLQISVTTPRKFRGKGKKPRPAKLGRTTSVYNGSPVTVGLPVAVNRPGTYTVVVTFVSTTPSPYNNSTVTTTFVVKKKKNRNR